MEDFSENLKNLVMFGVFFKSICLPRIRMFLVKFKGIVPFNLPKPFFFDLWYTLKLVLVSLAIVTCEGGKCMGGGYGEITNFKPYSKFQNSSVNGTKTIFIVRGNSRLSII